MDRNLALELVRVTESAALACGRWVGKGDKNSADEAATNAMRRTLDSIGIDGTVVIGEGEMDDAPMLYIGEKVGNGSAPQVDIAVDPLEGTNICAKGTSGAITTIALAPRGGFLNAPDMYMEKIAVGPSARGAIDINASATENLTRVAAAKKCYVEDLTVVILDRPRHEKLVAFTLFRMAMSPRPSLPPSRGAVSTCSWGLVAPRKGFWPPLPSSAWGATCRDASCLCRMRNGSGH